MANPNPYAQTADFDIYNKLYLNGIGGPFQSQINRTSPFGGCCHNCGHRQGGSWESAAWSPMNFDQTGSYTYTQGRKLMSTPLSNLIPANSGGSLIEPQPKRKKIGRGILAIRPLASSQQYDPIMRNLRGEMEHNPNPYLNPDNLDPDSYDLERLYEQQGNTQGGRGTKAGAKHNPWLKFLKRERALAKKHHRKFNISQAAEKYHALGH